MIWRDHGEPALKLIAVARLFRFRNPTFPGWGIALPPPPGNPQGPSPYLSVKKPKVWCYERCREVPGQWGLYLDGKLLCEMATSRHASGPCLTGHFGLAYYILLPNPVPADGKPLGRGPQATLYMGATPSHDACAE